MAGPSETIDAAYLGPRGSYSELALTKFLHPQRSLPCNSFTEVFQAVLEERVTCGFVPLENILQGPITETLDLLFEHHGKLHIETCYTLDIVHCLGAAPGTAIADLRSVHSHEQGFRQCSRFLAAHLAQAEQVVTRSTAQAAESLRQKDIKDAGVIAAEQTLTELGFSILARDIADQPGNRTRFAVIRKGPAPADSARPRPITGASSEFVTYIIIDPGRDRQGLLFELLELISVRHGVNLKFIHSRPDPRGIYVFHLNLEGHVSEPRITACLDALREYCRSTTGETAELIICGSYRQQRFHELPFNTVGIVGGDGAMGKWFRTLFEHAGLEVLVTEKEGGLPLSELAERSDVVLLSVPMSSAVAVAEELIPHLRAEHLVVENCSIKSCVLPTLLSASDRKFEILGVHTLFADDIPSLRDENIIITRTDSHGPKAQAFEDLLYKHGARLTAFTIEEHDRLSACFQSLLQCIMLALAETIRTSIPSEELLEPFSTPNSRALLGVLKRVVNQSENLIVDLQSLNDQYPRVRHRFLEVLFRTVAQLDQGDLSELIASANASKAYFR
ncbi:MAG: prephenate dehydrogenase/arogenate dehydrogenase family protein [Bdellovibrionales bacterium]|nr:prephenate dehydrogenase/arogenate dehydrogenase family protein [Bdellovibrionales bacterium]